MIIGAGPAGLSAAIWCVDLGLNVVILEQKETIGGQLLRTFNPINNYLGLNANNGQELLDLFSQQVKRAKFDLFTSAVITNVNLSEKTVNLQDRNVIHTRSIIIATGVHPKKLGITGEDKFHGRGIYYSGVPDRRQFAGELICIVGGGDAAAENALLFSLICPTVTIVCRAPQLSARQEFIDRINKNDRIVVASETVLKTILGDTVVEAVELEHTPTQNRTILKIDSLHIRAGVEPNSDLFKGQLPLDKKGFILTNHIHETTVPFVFAVGDVANPLAPTISGAVGDAATAAKVLAKYLN